MSVSSELPTGPTGGSGQSVVAVNPPSGTSQSRQCMIADMRIATWCVGSINARLKYLCHWLGRRNPDVVALQKTLARSDRFPQKALQQAGYESVFYSRDGESHNGWGAAVLSRKTLPKPRIL